MSTITGHKRFFVIYRNNKCTKPPVGINKFDTILTFLKLLHPDTYPIHSLRYPSVSLLVDPGRDICVLKLDGGYKLSTVAKS